MANPYVGECRLVGFNFAPVGWSICQGQLVSIQQNEVLFQLIGTTYGGDGISNFVLPNLQGRVPIHQASGYPVGLVGGQETVTITTQTMPQHTHALIATNSPATSGFVQGNVLGSGAVGSQVYNAITPAPSVAMNPTTLSSAGGSQPHDNLQPYLALNWIISMFGIFPSQ